MATLNLENLNIHYDEFHAVKEVNLEINEAEIMTLLGPSGCGKTSILRAIAGFNIPSSGRILMNDEDITYLPPQKRNMGMIFQNYALWPHMSVSDNIGYGLKIRGLAKSERTKQIERLIQQVQLDGQTDKFPGQLSGGQQQRVSLARALAIEPRILLCDEPLSNLDFKLRVELRTEIRNIAKDFGVTVIYVTHDQTEALAISDKIAVMDQGHIIQVGTPEQIYSDPDNHFVGRFVGENNLLSGTVKSSTGKYTLVEINSEVTLEVNTEAKLEPGTKIKIIIRQDEMYFDNPELKNVISGTLRYNAYMGNFAQVEIELIDGSSVMANIDENMDQLIGVERGASIGFQVHPDDIFVFDEAGQRIR